MQVKQTESSSCNIHRIKDPFFELQRRACGELSRKTSSISTAYHGELSRKMSSISTTYHIVDKFGLRRIYRILLGNTYSIWVIRYGRHKNCHLSRSK